MRAQTLDQLSGQLSGQSAGQTSAQSPASTTLSSGGIATPLAVGSGDAGLLGTQTVMPQIDEQGRVMREEEAQELRDSQNQPELPPEPPSPFQQMVQTTTGQRLEVYGASLFRHVPTTFAPARNVPVGPAYVVGPGDELILQLSGQVNRQYILTVDRAGAIQVPELGSVHVAGLTYGDLQGYLNRQLARIYKNFTLNVSIGSLRTIHVFVVGQARRPGSFAVSSLSTLLNALFASGGPLPTGSLRDIQVKRNGQTIDHFDLYDLLLRGDKSKDIALQTDDVIFIPFAGPQVAVLGSVNHPAIYELKGQSSVAQALEFAGGENALASGSDVLLERVYEHANRNVESVSLEQSKTEMLQGGDILSVRAVVDRFRNAVTLRGNVANPGRYAWKPGMHVSDLIPNEESLVTRDYWRKLNQLGQFLPAQQNASNAQGTMESQQIVPTPGARQAAGATGQAQSRATETTPENAQGAGLALNAVPAAAAAQNAANASAAQNQPGPSTSTSVGVAMTEGSARFPAKNDVALYAPDIDWSYAVIERQDEKTLTTSLIPFNLGKIVLNHDRSADVELLPGDVVTIFSKADIHVPSAEQTKYVHLEGEFVAAGVYSVLPGETLRGLLRRAGGLTPDAYLYASAFTRESTRRVEQQRLIEYANELEAQVTSTMASNQARATSPADAAAAIASETASRATVARLRQARPDGRIVLDLKPDSTGIDAIPDIALEDGDRFVVPRVPSSVNVEGEVYSGNAFIYQPGLRVSDYLHKAGGPNRQADRKRIFLLRADGSVVSKQYANVYKSPIYPGDTVVVPPILDRRGVFQRTLDIAQIIGSFGISLAAVAVLAGQ